MTTPAPPDKQITSGQGFSTLKQVMAYWVPARLWHTEQIRKGFRNLRTKG